MRLPNSAHLAALVDPRDHVRAGARRRADMCGRVELLGFLLRDPFASGRVRRVAVPPEARALSTLPRIDYEDATVLANDRARERTGEQWARAVLEDAPMPTRRALETGWFALGLQLGSTPSYERVLGWDILRGGPDYVLLGARSRLGLSAEVLCRRGEDTVLFATFLQRERSIPRVIWAGVGPWHRQVMRYLLEQAGRRERDRR